MSIAGGTIPSRAFHDELLDAGLLLPTGLPGVYGRSAGFEDTLDRIDRLITAYGAVDRPEVMRFPPIVNRADFERSGYLQSFPHLAGTIHSFAGSEPAHRRMMDTIATGGDWSAAFLATPLVLTPAACYPVYPVLTGSLPRSGRLVDVMSYCFRHEPSEDPGRMQMFRMHEHVRAGDPETVTAWRESWIARAESLTATLGLQAHTGVASDPFFGRGGKLLAVNQRDQRLKLEISVCIASEQQPTAIISLNYHQNHFGEAFAITTAEGGIAHTACVGFGLERLALALFRRHGFDRQKWPDTVRKALEL